jgi:catechol 2,3-dioxygenase
MTSTSIESSSTRATYGIAPAGYRLPEATRLGRVTLQVADLARSLAYYERVLGLRVLHRTPGVATLGSQDGDSPLVELRERPGAAAVPRRGRLGLYHFAILLPERAGLGRFVQHLAAIGEYAGMSDHLVSEAVYLTDPDGLGIEVYADRPRSEWQLNGRELAMTTEALDVDDLVRSGGGAPWTGMPAGTVIGHVHLFVGDLAKAAEFYHEGLGFDKIVWSYPGALFMGAGGYHHHLGTNTWAAGAAPATDADARLVEWEIIVPSRADASGALASLAARGVNPEPSPDGGLVARDPWGTAVRLLTPSPGG